MPIKLLFEAPNKKLRNLYHNASLQFEGQNNITFINIQGYAEGRYKCDNGEFFCGGVCIFVEGNWLDIWTVLYDSVVSTNTGHDSFILCIPVDPMFH